MCDKYVLQICTIYGPYKVPICQTISSVIYVAYMSSYMSKYMPTYMSHICSTYMQHIYVPYMTYSLAYMCHI